MTVAATLLTSLAEEVKQQLLKQKNLIIQWNNLLIYRFYVIAFPDLRNCRSNRKNWFII